MLCSSSHQLPARPPAHGLWLPFCPGFQGERGSGEEGESAAGKAVRGFALLRSCIFTEMRQQGGPLSSGQVGHHRLLQGTRRRNLSPPPCPHHPEPTQPAPYPSQLPLHGLSPCTIPWTTRDSKMSILPGARDILALSGWCLAVPALTRQQGGTSTGS